MTDSTNERGTLAPSMPVASSTPRPARYGRFVARGLMIAGFAGAAWLLSASFGETSASAAEVSASSASSELSGAAPALVESLVSHTAGPLTGPLSGGSSSTGEGSSNGPGAGAMNVTALLGSSVATVLRPVDDTVTVLRSASGRDEMADGAQPGGDGLIAGVLDTLQRSTLSLGAHAGRVGDALSRQRPSRATGKPRAQRDRAVKLIGPARPADLDPTNASGTTVVGKAATTVTGASRFTGNQHRSGAVRTFAPRSDRDDLRGTHHVPTLPRPAPSPAYPGMGLAGAAPSAGTGLHHTGTVVTVPHADAAAVAAGHRPEMAGDVELRLHSAEAPTTSPD